VKKEDYFLSVDDPTTSFKVVDTPNKQKIVDVKCNKNTQIVSGDDSV